MGMEALLEQHRLQQFRESLIELGVEGLEDFADVTEQDLTAMGMSPIQIRRLLRAVAADQSDASAQSPQDVDAQRKAAAARKAAEEHAQQLRVQFDACAPAGTITLTSLKEIFDRQGYPLHDGFEPISLNGPDGLMQDGITLAQFQAAETVVRGRLETVESYEATVREQKKQTQGLQEEYNRLRAEQLVSRRS